MLSTQSRVNMDSLTECTVRPILPRRRDLSFSSDGNQTLLFHYSQSHGIVSIDGLPFVIHSRCEDMVLLPLPPVGLTRHGGHCALFHLMIDRRR